jgi:hypothetical protein
MDQTKTRISENTYNDFITGLEWGIAKLVTQEELINSIKKDENYYTINGNPARHISFTLQSINVDCYMIAIGNNMYVEMYYAIPGSPLTEKSNATSIMQTFNTITSSPPTIIPTVTNNQTISIAPAPTAVQTTAMPSTKPTPDEATLIKSLKMSGIAWGGNGLIGTIESTSGYKLKVLLELTMTDKSHDNVSVGFQTVTMQDYGTTSFDFPISPGPATYFVNADVVSIIPEGT